MPIKSIWTITYDPGGSDELVICTPSNKLDAPVEISGRQNVQVTAPIDFANALHDGRGGVTRSLHFSVLSDHASLVAAMEYVHTQDEDMPVNLTGKTLRITDNVTFVVHDYASAVLEGWRVAPVPRVPFRVRTEFWFSAGALSIS